MRTVFLAAIVLAGACGIANATADTANLREWVQLDSEIQRATQALSTDAEGSRSAAEALLKRAETINAAFAAGREESDLSRAKRDALGGPLHNLRLALDHPEMATRMAAQRNTASGALMSAEGVAGVACERAIELVPGQPMRIEIPANGSRWIAVRSPLDASSPLALTTVGSDIDAAADVYADCREIGKAVLSSGDDNYGLQAIALLPPAAHPLLVKLRNLGERGIATIDAIQAVTISGRVTRADTGAAIIGMRVEAYRGTTPTVTQSSGSSLTQSNGDYQVVTYSSGAGPNTYVRTVSSTYDLQFVDEAFDNIPCSSSYGLPNCLPGVPTAIATEDGVSVSNINFALSPGATIHGQVLDRSGNPVSTATINVNQVGAAASLARSTTTDSAGRYRISALTNGQYRAVASGNGYKSQVFRDFDCDTDCGQIAGTPIVAAEFGIYPANFSLSKGNSIRVLLTVDGQPAQYSEYARAYAYNVAGTQVASSNYANSGSVLVIGPLAAGTYRVRVEGTGILSEYYQDIVCTELCGPAEFQAATPIMVNNDSPPVDITMDVGRVPEIVGIVTGSNGMPISNATVAIYPSGSQSSVFTSSNGTYRIRPASAGSYLVSASSPNHIDEIYDNIPCVLSNISSCVGTTSIYVGPGVVPAPVNFELAPSARIRGTVSRLPIGANFTVAALNNTNTQIYAGILTLLADGKYEISDLPAGQFRFGLSPGNDGRLQLFQNVDCGAQSYNFTQCPAIGATLVSLSSGVTVDGIDFTFRSRNGRPGQVTDEATGAPLAGIIIDLFNASTGQRVSTATTDATGGFEANPGYNSGNYTLATDNYRGYRNEVYSNIECATGSVYLGTCPLTGATPILFPGDGSTIVIALRTADMMFQSGFD